MLLSAVSVLVVAQSSSEIPEGVKNNPVYSRINIEKQIVVKKNHIEMKFETFTAVLWVIIVAETSVGYLHIL